MKRLRLGLRESDTELDYIMQCILERRMSAEEPEVKNLILRALCKEFFEEEEFYVMNKDIKYWCKGWDIAEKIILDITPYAIEGVYE